MIEYQAESRIESGSTMCLRKIPSNEQPIAEQGPANAQVASIGLELDSLQATAVERVAEQEVLRLDVRAGPPLGALEPRPADLGAPVERLDVQIPGRARPGGRRRTTTNGISLLDASARSNQRSKPSEYMFV